MEQEGPPPGETIREAADLILGMQFDWRTISGPALTAATALTAFIAQRAEMMRTGESTPLNINLRDGRVLRFSCTALPAGGRMLSYTPVTDLVRRTDVPPGPAITGRRAAAAIVALAGDLRAAE